MHELSLVAELVDECNRQAGGRPVRSVKVRCPSALDLDELRDLFAELAATSGLGDALLEIETVPTTLSCSCGFSGPLEAAESTGHLVVCPDCGTVQAAETGLELLAIRVAGLDSASRGPSTPRSDPKRP